ncbi:MAG: peptidylprolyl isomerase [Burkholderiaceae bacterium]
MKIARNSLVTIDVTMYDAQGNLIEASDAPLTYLHGHADIFPVVEQALEGKQAGDKLSVKLDPEEAFGDYEAELMHLVPLEALGADAVVGLRFDALPGLPRDGHTYVVTEIADNMAVLDANHPLAGWTLHFDIVVRGVEEPVAEDIVAPAAEFVPDFIEVVAPQDPDSADAKTQH